jgi:hypothetical protein
MISIKKGQAGKKIIFTGYEQSVLTNPYYLFVFTNRTTKDVVNVIKQSESSTLQKERFDYITININDYFANANDGFWTYQIYEQVNSSNTDTTGLNMVENGLMKLAPEVPFAPTVYVGNSNTAKTYGN